MHCLSLCVLCLNSFLAYFIKQAESAVSVALQSKLQQSELLAASLTQNWEAKWEKTHKIIQVALTDDGTLFASTSSMSSNRSSLCTVGKANNKIILLSLSADDDHSDEALLSKHE